MTFEEKLIDQGYDRIWQEYYGSLDLDLESYMKIQRRLLGEQIGLWRASPLGKRILKDRRPKSMGEFRFMVSLTTYEDYADVLLLRREDMPPDKPIIWTQTTWEDGKHPIKVAPYTSGMLKTYKNSTPACLMMATSKDKGNFDIGVGDTFLYGLALLSCITGLIPSGLSDGLHIGLLPPVGKAVNMTSSERNRKGLKMGLGKGIGLFFGVGSVTYYVSMNIASLSEGSKRGGSFLKKMSTMPPSITLRCLRTEK